MGDYVPSGMYQAGEPGSMRSWYHYCHSSEGQFRINVQKYIILNSVLEKYHCVWVAMVLVK